MWLLWTLVGIVAFIVIAFFSITIYCYINTFYERRKTAINPNAIRLPKGDVYIPYHKQITDWIIETRSMECREYSIKSFDGLTLYGKFYEYEPNAVIELMMHGYRGSSECDLAGAVQRSFSLGHSAFIIDQRACGKSEGNVITFGINEHRDCLSWIDFLNKEFGSESRIFLTGISMGASTVMIAAGETLPKNVVGVLADCGYSSAKEIIKKVILDRGLSPNLFYPFVKISAKLYGGFDLEEKTSIDALKHTSLPVIFYHGEADNFVPCDMSRRCYEACVSKKKLVTVPGAGHGLSYIIDKELYLSSLRDFLIGIDR